MKLAKLSAIERAILLSGRVCDLRLRDQWIETGEASRVSYLKSMLRVRKEQIVAMRTEQLMAFSERLALDLKALLPSRTEAMTIDEICAIIHVGVKKAARVDLIGERDVAIYVVLMLVLGEDFAQDESFPWVAEALSANLHGRPGAKIDMILRSLIGVLHEVRG